MAELVRGLALAASALALAGCLVSGTLGTVVDAATDGDSTTTTTGATSTGTPTSTGGDLCPGGEPGSCAACLGEFCCDDVPACDGGAACTCMLGCLSGGVSPLACVEQCGAGFVATQVAACAMKNCAPICQPG